MKYRKKIGNPDFFRDEFQERWVFFIQMKKCFFEE